MSVQKSVRQRLWLGVFWSLGILMGCGLTLLGGREVMRAYGDEQWFDHLRMGPLFFAAGLNTISFAAAFLKRNTIDGLPSPDEPHELLPMWWWSIVKILFGLAVFCLAIGIVADIFAPSH